MVEKVLKKIKQEMIKIKQEMIWRDELKKRNEEIKEIGK